MEGGMMESGWMESSMEKGCILMQTGSRGKGSGLRGGGLSGWMTKMEKSSQKSLMNEIHDYFYSLIIFLEFFN